MLGIEKNNNKYYAKLGIEKKTPNVKIRYHLRIQSTSAYPTPTPVIKKPRNVYGFATD